MSAEEQYATLVDPNGLPVERAATPPSTDPLAAPLWNNNGKRWDTAYQPGNGLERGKRGKFIPVKEKESHRLIIGLVAQGYSKQEAANMVGVSQMTVESCTSTPHAKSLIAEKIAHNVQGEIRNMIEHAGKSAVMRIINMAADETLKVKNPKLYSDLNQSLIDRLLGKAPLVVENHKVESAKLEDGQLDLEIERLRSVLITPPTS